MGINRKLSNIYFRYDKIESTTSSVVWNGNSETIARHAAVRPLK